MQVAEQLGAEENVDFSFYIHWESLSSVIVSTIILPMASDVSQTLHLGFIGLCFEGVYSFTSAEHLVSQCVYKAVKWEILDLCSESDHLIQFNHRSRLFQLPMPWCYWISFLNKERYITFQSDIRTQRMLTCSQSLVKRQCWLIVPLIYLSDSSHCIMIQQISNQVWNISRISRKI